MTTEDVCWQCGSLLVECQIPPTLPEFPYPIPLQQCLNCCGGALWCEFGIKLKEEEE